MAAHSNRIRETGSGAMIGSLPHLSETMLRVRDVSSRSFEVVQPPSVRRYFIVGIEKSARTADGSGQRWVTVLSRV